LYLTTALVLSVSADLRAQTIGTGSANAVNPTGLPPVDYPRPIQYGGRGAPIGPVAVVLSGLYQFSDQRSRVGGVSLDSESAGSDLTIGLNFLPYTSFDLSYVYSNASGSSPSGVNENVNQHAGSSRILQPLDWIWSHGWKPVTVENQQLNWQNSVILGASYGGSFSSAEGHGLLSSHGSTYPFVGNALYDLQYTRFLHSPEGPDNKYVPPYPNFVIELTSGVQWSDTWFDSSSRVSTTSSRQLTYQNLCSFTYSFCNRFGVVVGAEWDAPLSSAPPHGSRPYYANTAIFSGGLIYNQFPDHRTQGWDLIESLTHWNCWSISLLYSYTAFDPFAETGQLQVQISYSF
jgi:hypothetical protein